MTAVELRGAGATYRDERGAELPALERIDLDVAPGEFVALIGPSGCGKSTLLRLVADLVAPSTGEVLVGGRPASKARRAGEIAMVFQAPVLLDWRTVAENVALPLEVRGLGADERARRVQATLELVGLGAVAARRTWELSGGMQQRVAIARALATEPRVLLMDEPFAALDEPTRERLNDELLAAWTRTGTTILFVTHSITEAVHLAGRVVVIGGAPGRVDAIVPVDLPVPRGEAARDDPRAHALVAGIRAQLRDAAAAPAGA